MDRKWDEPRSEVEEGKEPPKETAAITTTTTGKMVTETKERVRCMYSAWKRHPGSESDEGFLTAAADLLEHSFDLTKPSEANDGGAELAATAHPKMLTWIHHCVGVSQLSMTHPIAMTAGIFLEKVPTVGGPGEDDDVAMEGT